MPSTVPMGRMPHNNKMGTSRTLETNNMWSKTIGHDPYSNNSELDNQCRTGGGESEDFKNLSRLVAKARGEEGAAGARSGWKGKKPLKGLFSAGISAQILPQEISYTSSDSSDSDREDLQCNEDTEGFKSKTIEEEKKRAKKNAKKEKKKAKKERKKAKKKEKKAKKKAKKEAKRALDELGKKRKQRQDPEKSTKKSKQM